VYNILHVNIRHLLLGLLFYRTATCKSNHRVQGYVYHYSYSSLAVTVIVKYSHDCGYCGRGFVMSTSCSCSP